MKILLNYTPAEGHLRALRAAAPDATFAVANDEESARRLIRDADALLGNRYFLQSIDHAQSLRWFQSNSAGMDLVLQAKERLGQVTVTNARGVYSDEIAEHAVALVLALFRRLHELRDEQHRRVWAPRPLATVSEATFLILGWGSVGSAIGRRLHALGGTVHGVARTRMVALSPAGQETVSMERDWRALLPATDCLVMALPLTTETRQLVGPEELGRLRSSAYVVNVGRGKTLDQEALVAALAASRLAGAALDVLEEEPPNAESPVWQIASLMLTPHVARSREENPPYKWEPLFVENVRRFAAGIPLLNVVDTQGEY
jgi:phosphoglycerate dehydrogenase-like enzyme